MARTPWTYTLRHPSTNIHPQPSSGSSHLATNGPVSFQVVVLRKMQGSPSGSHIRSGTRLECYQGAWRVGQDCSDRGHGHSGLVKDGIRDATGSSEKTDSALWSSSSGECCRATDSEATIFLLREQIEVKMNQIANGTCSIWFIDNHRGQMDHPPSRNRMGLDVSPKIRSLLHECAGKFGMTAGRMRDCEGTIFRRLNLHVQKLTLIQGIVKDLQSTILTSGGYMSMRNTAYPLVLHFQALSPP